MNYAICGARIFNGEKMLHDHAVVVEGERIAGVVETAKLPAGIGQINRQGGILAPGFIDLQVNGGGGVLLNNAPERTAVDTMTSAHRRYGTTAMMPTIVSDTPKRQRACVEAVQAAMSGGNQSVLGVHLEGPFLDLDKRGVHKAGTIRQIQDTDIDWLCSLQMPAIIVTLAPEHTRAGQIRQLTDSGILVCAGHTNAHYEELSVAIGEGLRGFTHLYNAMRPQTGREPGVVGAALDSDSTWVGIIADGHHVHPANIRIVQKIKPRGKTLLVSDAMASVGGPESFIEIYGEKIEEKEGRLVNSEGVLAGSAIGMIDAVRISTELVGISLEESLRMASLYPAEFLHKSTNLGRIAEGFRADLVCFDDNYTVLDSWVAGQHEVYHRPLATPAN
jgi:N-acetylglucosamine-6-phosphate deacetylase